MPRLSLRADAGVGAAAISPTSRDAVLAGRSGLYIVDLHDPFALPRWLPLRSVWEVACVQWCPHAQRPACLASSSNQKALIWNLALPSEQSVEHVLHGHRRAVTDIDFSPYNSDQLATASIDTTIKIWDLRQTKVAAMTFSDFAAGAIQTRWSSLDEHQIASAHDNRFVLWDNRRANLPVATVAAHRGECNGLQFLANGRLLTCSTDRTVKSWDLRDIPSNGKLDIEPEVTIEAGYPVWRAIPTPFELGALVVPLRGGDNSVSLINLARQTGTKKMSDVQIGGRAFQHPETVSTAAFMRSDQSTSHYDIVTWCRDSHLREWDGSILQDLPHASSAAGCKDDDPPALPKDIRTFSNDDFDNISSAAVGVQGVFDLPMLNRRRKDDVHAIGHLDWIAGVRLDQKRGSEAGQQRRGDRRKGASSSLKDSVNPAEQLSQEIIYVSSRFPKVYFDDINIGAGTCDFNLNGPWGPDHKIVLIRIKARIPHEYPYQPMQITLSADAELHPENSPEQLTRFLNETTLELSRHGIHALEFCVRYLVGDPVSFDDYLASESGLFDHARDAPRSESITNGGEIKVPIVEDDAGQGVDDGEFIEFEDDDDNDDDDDDSFNTKLSSSKDSDSDSGYDDTSEDEKDVGNTRRLSNNKYEISRSDHLIQHAMKRDDIIDSTPVPKNCGAVWSPTGFLVCFFNHKPVGRDKGPLPLDKVFADDARSDDTNAPFLSDSEDFEQEMPMTLLRTTANWSITAAQLTANPTSYASSDYTSAARGANGPGVGGSAKGIPLALNTGGGLSLLGGGRNRSRTLTSATSDDRSLSMRHLTAPISTHTVIVKNMLHMWPCRPDIAAEYRSSMSGKPLEVVEHNIKVAMNHDLWEDEQIWRIIHSYISAEEAECMDPHACLSGDPMKFDWSGGSTGLKSFLPRIATHLEQEGKVQLLACISLVFSALRSRRSELRQATALTKSLSIPVTVIEPGVESVFQAHPDGSVVLVSDHPDTSTIHSREGALDMHTADSSWIDNELPGTSTMNVDGNETLFTQSGRRHSTFALPNKHPDLYMFNDGPLVGVEINNLMFDHGQPPSSFAVLQTESTADKEFSEWLPRLLGYRYKYASLLQTWGLNVRRAEVLKLNPYDALVLFKMDEITAGHAPHEMIHIDTSKNAPCALCNAPVTRLFEYCDQCSHIMHSQCAQQWWEFEHECPAACGCDCKRYVS